MEGKKKLSVIIAADIDVSKFAGDTGRTLAFASELKKQNCDVTLVVPVPKKNEMMIRLSDIRIEYVPIKRQDRSILNILLRRHLIIKRVKQLNKNSILLIETSVLGGHFALAGVSNYIVDVHGIAFDEVNFANLPWFLPKHIYRLYIYLLEKIAVRKSARVIAVSKTMAHFISNEWKIPENKVTVIPNGYFSSRLNAVLKKGIQEEKGTVTFVGYLTKWGMIDKIIRTAIKLKNEVKKFYIVGEGTEEYLQYLKNLVRESEIDNIVFTGKVPLERAYEIIAQSEILLLPFPRSICTEVACPIKVIEYMAFGKAMVLDNVGDLPKLLEKKNAALVSNPNDETDFIDKIKILLENEYIRKQIGYNAKKIASNFTWEHQTKKLLKILENDEFRQK